MEVYLHYHVTDKCPHMILSGRDPQKISRRASATINWNHPFSFSRSATGADSADCAMYVYEARDVLCGRYIGKAIQNLLLDEELEKRQGRTKFVRNWRAAA